MVIILGASLWIDFFYTGILKSAQLLIIYSSLLQQLYGIIHAFGFIRTHTTFLSSSPLKDRWYLSAKVKLCSCHSSKLANYKANLSGNRF